MSWNRYLTRKKLEARVSDYCYYGKIIVSNDVHELRYTVPYGRVWGARDGHPWAGEFSVPDPLPDELRGLLGGSVHVQAVGDAVSGTAWATGELIGGIWIIHLAGRASEEAA